MKYDDSILQRLARDPGVKVLEPFLEFLLNLVFLCAGLVTILNLILDPQILRVVIGSVLMIAMFVLRIYAQLGRQRVVRWGLPLVLWSVIGTAVFLSGGLESPLFPVLLFVPGFAWLLSGWGSGVIFLGLSLFPVGAVFWASVTGMPGLPVLAYHPLSWLLLPVGAGIVVYKVRALTQGQGADRRTPTVPSELERTAAEIGPGDKLLDVLTDGVIFEDPENRIVFANRAAEGMLGLPLGSLMGRPLEQFVHSEDLESYHLVKTWVAEGSENILRELRFVRTDRTILPAEIRGHVVTGPEGTVSRFVTVLRDVSSRTETSIALRDSEQKLRAFFESTEDVVYLKNLNGTYVLINPAGVQKFGKSPAEVLLKVDEDIFTRDDALKLRALDEAVVADSAPRTDETNLSIGGESRSFLTTRLPYYLEDGKISGVIGIMRDITQRKKVEAALRATERRYRALFDSGTDGILILDLVGQIIDLSDQGAWLLGYSREELIGQSVLIIIPEIERPDHARRFNALLSTSAPSYYERILQRKNGKLLPTEVSVGLVYGDDGAPRFVQKIFRDISERKRVDLERNDLLDNLQERTRQIQTAFEVSKSISSTLELRNLINRTVEIIKQRFSFYYVGLFLVEGGEAVLEAGSGEQGRQMLASGHRLTVGSDSMIGWCIEHRRARLALDVGKDSVRFNNPLTPLTRSELALPLVVRGKPIGALTVQSEYPDAFSSEDVAVLQIMADQLAIAVQNARLHERITAYAGKLEDRVRERTAQLESANQELESFSYSISHDLRTPLRAIHGYSNIVLSEFIDELSPDVSTYLDKIRANALRMGDLIDDILAFSRMGRKPVRRTTCDPNPLVADILEDLQPELAGRRVDFRIADLPQVQADQALLKQVFANLISNAVKFTLGRADTVIEVGFSATENGPAFFVRDNGVGFDMKFSDRIFGVFQRLHRDDEFEGTGVGLAIVHRIIERHGGKVWFDAHEGAGAVFYFSLPDTSLEDEKSDSR